jgi:hypothetical protein
MPNEAFRRLDATRRIQQGLWTRRQAFGAGFKKSYVDEQLRRGTWAAMHPGIYYDGAVPSSWYRDQMGAVMWGHPALAAGAAAAFLHELPGFDQPPIEIVTTNRRIVPRSGIVVHYTKWLPPEQETTRLNIPCTTVERTVLDLCGTVGRRRGAIALDHTLHKGLATLGGYDRCLFLTARRGRNGCGILRELVKERLGMTEFPNTPLETVVFEMIANSSLPMPVLQDPIPDPVGKTWRPDFVFPQQKVIVEAHSKLWHTGMELEGSDAERHERLLALGYKIIYVTWTDATLYADATVRFIERTLLDRGWKPWDE